MLEWASQLSEDGRALEKHAFASFLELLREHESKTATALANKLRELSVSSRKEQDGNVASVDTLVRQFERLSRFCNHIKAGTAANEFEALALALAPKAQASVDDLVAAAKTALATRSRTAQRARASVDPTLVSSYVARFQSPDEKELERAEEALKADGAISKDALFQVVNAVSGHVGPFRSKKAAYDDLRVALIEQARFRNKLRSPDGRGMDKD
jgi:hypothetical protein